MVQVIHGVNNYINKLILSEYSLTFQIVIINISTALLGFIFMAIFNFFLLTSNKTLETHNDIIDSKLEEITFYLSNNAIKRIFTFDDTCNRILKEQNLECKNNNFLDKNYEDKKPQLDPTYTQKYIYSNFLDTDVIVKIFADNWIKFADTSDFSDGKQDIFISDINAQEIESSIKYAGIYKIYKKFYFKIYNFFQKFFDEKKIKNLKNDNITIMETIKTKAKTSYIFKDQDEIFKSISASPIIKYEKVYGVVLLISPFNHDNSESAYQSFLLTNFFLFFISTMFLLSLLFSKSIVAPIKLLSHNTQLERDKTSKKKNYIKYPNRKDEIGILSNDIQEMSNDLKKRIKEIEEFTADVSHELKNPLSGLKSANDLLALDIKKISEKDRNILIKNMRTDIDRMNILISDISNYTLTQLEISEEGLEEIEIIDFLNNFKKSLTQKIFILDIESNESKINLKINQNKFIQVLHNLIDNSTSFIPKNSTIKIFIKLENNNCIINFSDQGPGIRLIYKDRIFERFYTDRKNNIKSHSGLGLSISKNIIESFGGKINLTKSNNLSFNGACFEIKLPYKDS